MDSGPVDGGHGSHLWILDAADRICPNQEEDRTSFKIGVEMPREAVFEDTASLFCRGRKGDGTKESRAGFDGYMAMHQSRGQYRGWLNKEVDHALTATEMAEKVMKDPAQTGRV